MLLSAYLSATQRLLQNPPAASNLYAPADLTSYINTARTQLSGEAECVRSMATLPVMAATRVYPFASVVISTAGVATVINIKQAAYLVAGGQRWIRGRPFPWFMFYRLNNPVPVPGFPNEWAQYAQGTTGSIYLDPVPDGNYTLVLDCVCTPVDLVSDATVDAIPALWSDAVPYYAAYMALLSSQRTADADKMFTRYTEFVNRARRANDGSQLPQNYPQAGDPTRANKMGTGGGGAAPMVGAG